MKLFDKNKRELLEIIIILGFAVIWNFGAYLGGRTIASGWYHYDMTLPVDKYVPFLPWTIIIYFGCYLLWGVNYLICAFNEDKAERSRYFCADIIAKGISFLIFIIIPTTNVRPEIAGTDFWSFCMKFLFWIDAPDNLFPSIHCLASWLCWIGIRKRKDIPAAYRYFSLIFALAVCISTLTTRQHVIVDVFAGVFLAEFSYFIAGFNKVNGIYNKVISFFFRIFKVDKVK